MSGYFPTRRVVIGAVTMRREVLLPDGVSGQVNVKEGARVDMTDQIARGQSPTRLVIIEALDALGLRNAAQLGPMLKVAEGDTVRKGQFLAGRNENARRKVVSPINGTINSISEGRIIMRERPQVIDLQAGMRGRVVSIRQGRGAVLETIGGVVQGVWGNGRRGIGPLRMEPSDGLEFADSSELDLAYRGAVMVTRGPLHATGLFIAEEQGFAAIIAPSIDYRLLENAQASEIAILLTEGFGEVRMSNLAFNMLSELVGGQATVDAVLPGRLEARRPEVVVQIRLQSRERPPRLRPSMQLRAGAPVRITREPYAGLIGKVVELPSAPVLLPNGLRLPCARVELIGGRSDYVPLMNLELYGL